VRELPRTEEQSQAIAQQTLDMTAVEMKQQQGDRVEWIVDSDQATYNETLRQAELKPVRFRVLSSGGKNPHPVDMTGTADLAFLDQSAQRILLQGSARVKKDNNLELKGDKLEYFRQEGVIRATGHVEVRQDAALVQGDFAEYTIDTGKVNLKAPRLYQ